MFSRDPYISHIKLDGSLFINQAEEKNTKSSTHTNELNYLLILLPWLKANSRVHI